MQQDAACRDFGGGQRRCRHRRDRRHHEGLRPAEHILASPLGHGAHLVVTRGKTREVPVEAAGPGGAGKVAPDGIPGLTVGAVLEERRRARRSRLGLQEQPLSGASLSGQRLSGRHKGTEIEGRDRLGGDAHRHRRGDAGRYVAEGIAENELIRVRTGGHLGIDIRAAIGGQLGERGGAPVAVDEVEGGVDAARLLPGERHAGRGGGRGKAGRLSRCRILHAIVSRHLRPVPGSVAQGRGQDVGAIGHLGRVPAAMGLPGQLILRRRRSGCRSQRG